MESAEVRDLAGYCLFGDWARRDGMSTKKRKKNRTSNKNRRSDEFKVQSDSRESSGQPDAGPSSFEPRVSMEIKKLIQQGNTRPALEMAKQADKAFGTPEAREILILAYRARIQQLADHGALKEARALFDLVQERYSPTGSLSLEMDARISARAGELDELLRPLNDPNLSQEQRSVIEKVILQEVTDLSGIAKATTLPPDHPLKITASSALRAFEAVTSGLVSAEDVALNEIPRRSPLAPWKMLIKALAAFYSQDDELCGKCLEAIPNDSAPGRLAPAIRSMISGKTANDVGNKTSSLIQRVLGRSTSLQNALEDLEKAFARRNSKKLKTAVQNAVGLCEKTHPELVERLRQHVSVRVWLQNSDEWGARIATDGPSLKNAYFWRLMARAAERKEEWFLASALWAEFVLHGRQEALFSGNGKGLSVVYLHMAGLLRQVPRDVFGPRRSLFMKAFHGLGDAYRKGQPPSVLEAVQSAGHDRKDPYYLYPERLYQRACDLDPDPAHFQKWLQWGEEVGLDWRQMDDVALSWHRSLPNDARPLLALSISAEKRNAFQKALRYLEQAEERDRLNPAVKRARVRLLVSIVIRHLGERKVFLARKDLAEMAGLPQFQEGDRPGFLIALNAVCAAIQRKNTERAQLEKELTEWMGSPLATAMILSGISIACRAPDFDADKRSSSQTLKGEALALSIARACALGEDMGIRVSIPRPVAGPLERFLASEGSSLDIPAIQIMGETAMRSGNVQLAYAASGAGLRKGVGFPARLLLLRAQSLPAWERERQDACIGAAIALARRERDMELLHQCIEWMRKAGGHFYDLFDDSASLHEISRTMDMEEVQTVLQEEGKARDYPSRPLPQQRKTSQNCRNVWVDENACRECDKSDCRHRRVPYDPGWDDDWDDGDWDDDEMPEFLDLDWDGVPPGMKRKLEKRIMDMALKYAGKGGRIPTFEELLEEDPTLLVELLEMMHEEDARGNLPNPGMPARRKGGSRKRQKKG
jgi:tetratricopeptide (TPR) repeat protein